jgi:hypothetical protein
MKLLTTGCVLAVTVFACGSGQDEQQQQQQQQQQQLCRRGNLIYTSTGIVFGRPGQTGDVWLAFVVCVFSIFVVCVFSIFVLCAPRIVLSLIASALGILGHQEPTVVIFLFVATDCSSVPSIYFLYSVQYPV